MNQQLRYASIAVATLRAWDVLEAAGVPASEGTLDLAAWNIAMEARASAKRDHGGGHNRSP